jgi:hypothetical protein
MLARVVLLLVLCVVALAVRGRQREPTSLPSGKHHHRKHWRDRSTSRGHSKKYRRFRKNQLRNIVNINGVHADGTKTIITDWLDQDWVGVPFGPQGSSAERIFIIKNRRRTTIDFVDLYCIGDTFRIEITKVHGRKRYILTTDPVNSDYCHTRTSDPEHAWESGLWSAGTITVPKGHYVVKIFVESSPFAGGSAAIRAYDA